MLFFHTDRCTSFHPAGRIPRYFAQRMVYVALDPWYGTLPELTVVTAKLYAWRATANHRRSSARCAAVGRIRTR
jgi:hypothetical protein